MKHHSLDTKTAAFIGLAYHRLVQVRTGRALFVCLSLLLLPVAVVLSMRGYSATAPWLLFLYFASSLLSCFFVKRSPVWLAAGLAVHLLFIASFVSAMGPLSLGFFLLYVALWVSALPNRQGNSIV